MDGDYYDEQNGIICISLRTTGAPAPVRDREVSELIHMPKNVDGDDFLSTLEMDGDLEIEPQVESNTAPVLESDNPNEAIIPPPHSEVPAARLSDFRCGGGPIEYPAPNGLASDDLCTILVDTVTIYPSSFGGLGDVTKTKFDVLVSDVKLDALSPGLSDSSRAAYKSSWMGCGAFLLR